MTLQQLRYLIAVAEHGSMTGAAQELFVVQPALSRSLQSLERELNVTLFTRVGRGLVLTAAGIQVVNLARKVIRGVQGIRDIVRVDDSAHTGTVRLATTATLAIEFTSGLLPGLAKLHPELAIVIDRHDSREALFASLRAGRADIALVDLPAPGGFEVLPLRTYEVVLVSPKGVRIPDPVSWTELDGLPMILPTRGSGGGPTSRCCSRPRACGRSSRWRPTSAARGSRASWPGTARCCGTPTWPNRSRRACPYGR